MALFFLIGLMKIKSQPMFVSLLRRECATTRTAAPEKWCSKTNRENGKTESTRSLNFHLDDLQQKVHDAHAVMVKEGKKITAAVLRDKFLGRDVPQKIPTY